MNHTPSRTLLRAALLAIAAGSITLGGCALSSDPTQGGLFWSESGSRERIQQREALLRDIQRDTAETEARSARLDSQIRQQR